MYVRMDENGPYQLQSCLFTRSLSGRHLGGQESSAAPIRSRREAPGSWRRSPHFGEQPEKTNGTWTNEYRLRPAG